MSKELNSLFDRIIETNCILVASAHHTGTWFALNFLLKANPDYEVLEFRKLLEDPDTIKKESIVHFHLTGETINSRGVIQGFKIDDAIALMNEVRTLVPLRDPLSSVLSRHERHPELQHFFILDAFIYMNQLPESCQFLPVDVNHGHIGRQRLLLKILYEFGICPPPYEIEKYARDWPTSNTRGNYPIKILYEKHRDVESVNLFVPGEYRYLIANKHKIQPFLESKGYIDLPWFA